jgi:hypothetical protein
MEESRNFDSTSETINLTFFSEGWCLYNVDECSLVSFFWLASSMTAWTQHGVWTQQPAVMLKADLTDIGPRYPSLCHLLSFEKSAGALGAAGPRWDPFVKATEAFIRKERGGFRRGWAQMGPFRKRARPCGLSQIIKKREPERARGTHHARAWWT